MVAQATRRWRLGLATLASVALVATLVGVRAMRAHASAPPSRQAGSRPRAVPVVGATARSGDLGVFETGLGTVTPVRTATVRSRVDGELMSVNYREGQAVRAGEVLAQIDPRPFEVQLHQAEAQLAKDEAGLRIANADFERYRTLTEQGVIPKQQLDAQAASVDQIEASIKSDRASVESAKLNLTYSRIEAPISGIIGLRLVDPGNIVHATDANGLLVITQQQPISVVFTIAADRLPPVARQVKAGRSMTVEAWDRDFKARLATGTVLAIDNQIDPATGTVRVKALFPNEDSALYPSQFVNTRLLVDTLRHAVLVPAAALQRSPQSTFVYLVKPDSTVEMRSVEVQRTEGDDAAIGKGISPGEVVVIDGVDKLQPGTTVALAKEGSSRKPVS